jgi:hypothetical protein
MQHNLSCEQVLALLTFYTEGKLSPKLSELVKKHLQNCQECNEKYNNLLNLLKSSIQEQDSNPYLTRQYEDFKTNLSAYVDNELNDLDNIKIKKIAISNPLARKDLENMYTYKKLLHTSFEKTKNDVKNDYSRNVMCKVKEDCQNTDPFFKIAAMFFVMIACLVSGVIFILYL